VYFQHAPEMWSEFPELVPGVLQADGITSDADVDRLIDQLCTRAAARLETGTEADLPEIQAWRRAFSQMGLKPTQYRCASEALLRRFRKEGTLPRIHPLIDFCNAASLAFAIPIAVFDVSEIVESLEVRHATGGETYRAFSGESETIAAGEVIFADTAGQAHARRWTNRQSALSAVRDETTSVLVVAEALHESAGPDMRTLMATIEDAFSALWSVTADTAILNASSRRFELGEVTVG
jgi:DNA/RNA-binding domain of Phe-tRNA-synthetase-like protein